MLRRTLPWPWRSLTSNGCTGLHSTGGKESPGLCHTPVQDTVVDWEKHVMQSISTRQGKEATATCTVCIWYVPKAAGA